MTAFHTGKAEREIPRCKTGLAACGRRHIGGTKRLYKKPGETYLTYVASEDIYHWNRGDLLKVKVTEVGPTGLASFLYRVIGLNMAPVDFSLAGRIRS